MTRRHYSDDEADFYAEARRDYYDEPLPGRDCDLAADRDFDQVQRANDSASETWGRR